jgi:hypothetical protein
VANYAAAVAEVGEVKTRLWLAYLAASSITFAHNGARLYQTLASKRRRGPSGLPPTRADLYCQDFPCHCPRARLPRSRDGGATAALRDFDPADDRLGSIRNRGQQSQSVPC